MELVLLLGLFTILVIPTGKYLYDVSGNGSCLGDKIFSPVEKIIYKFCGISQEDMNWKQYLIAMLWMNFIFIIFGYIWLRTQSFNLFNLTHAQNMGPNLAFNTIISFVTNTDMQNYAVETYTSLSTQLSVMMYAMFFSAACSLCICLGFMRGLAGKEKKMGNFYVILTRVFIRVLLPISIVIGIILVSQGVPQTFEQLVNYKTIEGENSSLLLGPIASFEAIKHLGTNGGGYFTANAAHPFENPTSITNFIHMLAMMLLPGSLVVTFGHIIKNKKQAGVLFMVMGVLFISSMALIYYAESAENPSLQALGVAQSIGNMEGKEVRFGILESSLFSSVTTAFSTGSVNSMLDSYTPLGSVAPLINMMIGVVFGGAGTGFVNIMMYVILTVFICGLMVGRTPELFSKKIEVKEMKLIAIAILIQPILILVFTAMALILPDGVSGITNPSFHGLTQVLYQYTSAAANNGSGFEGLLDDSMFYHITTGIVMFYGRFLSLIIMLAVSASLAQKKFINESSGTLKTDNLTFAGILLAIILIIGALTYLPALVLGPIAESLKLLF